MLCSATVKEQKVLKPKLGNIKYIFSTIKSSFVPAMFLLSGLVMFYAQNPYSYEFASVLHYIFLISVAITMVLLYVSNQSNPFFIVLIAITSYLITNYLKIHNGESFTTSANFRCLCFVLPFNILFLYFLKPIKLTEKRNIFILLLLLLQACIFQHFSDTVNMVEYIDITLEAMPLLATILWITVLVTLAVNISFNNTIINTGIFYAVSCLFIGCIYASENAGITTFYTGFSLIILLAIIIDLYHRYRYDYLEYVGSKNSYLSHANSKFPFKYTIALFSIDNRDKLLKVIGEAKMQTLEQMLVNRIHELPYELTIYRYNESELILAFKNEDATHTKEFVENIRRTVAAAEFIFTGGKKLKITISLCVTEKTRKDLNATEVLERAHQGLQKIYRYNGNVVTVA